ncbi:hypothetical protein [Clostridium botulinum]|uniref:hypothetical protein n=1 Tax=Clostridium botulinum TaxID=1491 RepID=UPI00069BD225|nr:hypothetical protein [Clostridium botulinum]KOA90880.1 hypothetical protein ADU76_12575 [Clostridium botulinum]MCD3203445.1 hypothetical protein [Clostridium botulinum C/D]MCD3222308.1 hypothetical protein [Clostridium botulinum C/D]MCD3231421.1 hypothetical protein [Clostridium botulinum C/D]MCD3273081.1 hypothetical protein [Clostridium botulinum C/D]
MRKCFILIFVTFIMIFSLSGCSNNATQKTDSDNHIEKKENVSKKEKNVSKLDGLKETFKNSGFKVGENEELAYAMLNATNGYKFKLNDKEIEIYEYDMKKLNEEGKKIVNQAKKGSISFSGLNIPVKFKNGLMIVRYDEHKDKDKILEIFNSYN